MPVFLYILSVLLLFLFLILLTVITKPCTIKKYAKNVGLSSILMCIFPNVYVPCSVHLYAWQATAQTVCIEKFMYDYILCDQEEEEKKKKRRKPRNEVTHTKYLSWTLFVIRKILSTKLCTFLTFLIIWYICLWSSTSAHVVN